MPDGWDTRWKSPWGILKVLEKKVLFSLVEWGLGKVYGFSKWGVGSGHPKSLGQKLLPDHIPASWLL